LSRLAVLDAHHAGELERGRAGRVGDRHHDVGLEVLLAHEVRQRFAEAQACLVDRDVVDHAVGAGEVDVLEHARTVPLGAGAGDDAPREAAVHADDDGLARGEVADEVVAEHLEDRAARHAPGGACRPCGGRGSRA
jgi:hypothetical protein